MAWWLLDSVINGTMETDYPVKDINLDDSDRLRHDDPTHYVDGHGDVHLATSRKDFEDGLPSPFSTDPLADNDDNWAHHFNLNNEVQQETESMTAHYFKYHEEEILKDIESYVSATYRGHYTGNTHEYRNVQTLDLMAARDIASGFCQANIIKYGSRYGSKEGKEKKDLLKVIHYAMLLLHFDDHYGKPSITTGNIDHTMP